jgi:hypothetical protein
MCSHVKYSITTWTKNCAESPHDILSPIHRTTPHLRQYAKVPWLGSQPPLAVQRVRRWQKQQGGRIQTGFWTDYWGHNSDMILVHEVAMMQVMERITDKPDWHIKISDDETARQWEQETLDRPNDHTGGPIPTFMIKAGRSIRTMGQAGILVLTNRRESSIRSASNDVLPNFRTRPSTLSEPVLCQRLIPHSVLRRLMFSSPIDFETPCARGSSKSKLKKLQTIGESETAGLRDIIDRSMYP